MSEIEMKLIEEAEEELEDQRPEWTPENDAEADWCIEQINNAEEEKAKWKAFYDEQKRKVFESCDTTIANMKHFLLKYFQTVPHKETKTEENYRLRSGKLVMKKPTTDFERDDEEVIRFLEENGGEKYLKTIKVLDWAQLKKSLTVMGETVADENGQIIPGIKAVEKPEEFKIGK